MIYPAIYDTTILQNATWKAVLRATEQRQVLSGVTVSGGYALFTAPCHGLTNGTKVVFTAEDLTASGATGVVTISGVKVPCGLSLNSIYFVLSSGLTNNAFYVATTSGGTAVQIQSNGEGVFYAAKPVNLTGYTVDADVRGIIQDVQVATFNCSITDAVNGEFLVTMPPAVSSEIEAGRYNYDVSLTNGPGERYYWLSGIATVQRTYSRN